MTNRFTRITQILINSYDHSLNLLIFNILFKLDITETLILINVILSVI